MRWVVTLVSLTLLFVVRAVVRGEPAPPVDLGLMVARTAANEGAFKYRSTTALVWQVVRVNGGKTNDTRADFLARHSPKANGFKPCHVSNCLWSHQIPPRTWGGPMDRDKAIKRGLYPIGCYGGAECSQNLCNDGFTWYAQCWRDGLWVCDPSVEPVVQSVPEPEGLASL
jgi:hypothetical protein